MADTTNPISGPYAVSTPLPTSLGKYNRTVLVNAPFMATGSAAGNAAFFLSGSADAVLTLTNGGTLTVPGVSNQTPTVVFEFGIKEVVSGSIYLLYNK